MAQKKSFISMTGYGRVAQSLSDREVVIEMKSVNHKGLEIIVRSPSEFSPLESLISKYINQYVRRGRVEIFISYTQNNSTAEPSSILDMDLAKHYYNSARGLAEQLHIPPDITVGQLLSMPGIIKALNNNNRTPVTWELFQPVLVKAVKAFTTMRETEGVELQKDIMTRIKSTEDNVKKIHKYIPQALKTRQNKLRENIKALFEKNEIKIEPNQVAAAAITLLDQCDVTEELVRVDSHLSQFHDTVKSGDSIGRRLDFIVQELFREFTTIGSKTNHAEIGKLVVDIKTDLDKIKQQIANIE